MARSASKGNVLILTIQSEEVASTRQRILDYVPFLEEQGIRCVVKPAIPLKYSSKWGRRRDFLRRLGLLGVETVLRFSHILRSVSYDAVLVQKALFSTYWRGSARLLALCNPNIIYDIDDAVFRSMMTELPMPARILQDEKHIEKLVALSRRIIAGNPSLEAYARSLNPRCIMIPTSMSLKRYTPRSYEGDPKTVVIGWSGSDSTNENVNRIADVLRRLHAKYKNIRFLVISNSMDRIDLKRFGPVPVEFLAFHLPTYIEDLHTIDIGIMPLEDTEWNRMKCGGKLLQYMACAIPAAASPVGVNLTIVEHGRNGFLASTDDEWVEILSRLIESAELRKTIALEGRKTVEQFYSVESQAPVFLGVIQSVLKE